MDDMVVVDIKTPTNEILSGSMLPYDYTVQLVIDELIDSLELPRLDEMSNPIRYFITSARQQRTLSNQESISSARIQNGDILELQILQQTVVNEGGFAGYQQQYQQQQPPHQGQPHQGQPHQAPQQQHQPPPTINSSQELNVVLSVMDLNRHDNVNLPVTHPIGELIRLIVSNYNLPARDHLNQIIKYKLQSKALGRFLDERMTLLDAQIPPLDRLTLHRDEIAG